MSQAITEARQLALEEMDKLVAIGETRSLTEDEATRFDALEAEVADLDKRAAQAAKVAEMRGSAPTAAVVDSNPDVRSVARATTAPNAGEVREVSPYGEASDNSWFVDQRTLKDRYASDSDVAEARERLSKHYASTRDEGGVRQVRALTTTTDTEGGYLVAPAHVQSLFAKLLVAGATVTQLVSKVPLPPKTDQINLPVQNGATAVALHTQNNAITETSATFSTVQINALRYGGAQTIPNFLVERSLPGVDQIIMADLARQLAKKINTDLIAGTGNGLTAIEGILSADSIGTATATAATATLGDLWPAIVNAVSDVQAAHYASPDAIVMHPRRWSWMLAQLDSEDRPLLGAVMPYNAVGGFAGAAAGGAFGADEVARPVGQILGIPVYLDACVPTTEDTDQDRIIVGVFREAMLFQSAPSFGVSTQAEFLKDQTIVKVTQDVAFTAERYPGAFSCISGTALNDTA